jgi:hypothetical protein
MVNLTEPTAPIERGFNGVTEFSLEEHARVGMAAALNIAIFSTNSRNSREEKHNDMEDMNNLTGFLFEYV